MGTMFSMIVLIAAIGTCMWIGGKGALARRDCSVEPWWCKEPLTRNVAVICVSVISLFIIDAATPRSEFFPTIITVAEVRYNLMISFWAVLVFCLLLMILDYIYGYCAPTEPVIGRKWPIISRAIIIEQMMFTILIVLIIASSNHEAAYLEIMGGADEPIQRYINIAVTFVFYIFLLRKYVDIGETYVLYRPYYEKTLKTVPSR